MRETVETPEKAQKILESLALHPSKSRACRAARISRAAFYRWVAKDPEFATQIEAARQHGIDAIEDAMFELAGSKKDTTAAIFMLKSWRPDRYRETTRQELSGPGGEPLQFAGVLVPLPTREDDGE